MLKRSPTGKVAVRLRFGVRPAEDRPGTANRVDGRALAAAAVTVVLWASAFVSIRSSAGHFGPGALALGRLLVGAVVLGALLLARREGLPPREAWRGIAGSGILWFGAYMVALNGGEHEVDAGTASMVVNVGPILIALLSGWLLKEGFPPRLLAGMGVSFAGAVVVGLSLSGGGASSLHGVALCLVAAVTYAVGVVLQKPALKHAPPLQVTTLGCLVSAAARRALPRGGGPARQEGNGDPHSHDGRWRAAGLGRQRGEPGREIGPRAVHGGQSRTARTPDQPVRDAGEAIMLTGEMPSRTADIAAQLPRP